MIRVGLYPGTFDPIHNGHIDLIGRAVKLVDKLVLGVAINAGKGPMFSLDERVAIAEEVVEPLRRRTEILVQPFEFQMTAMNQQLDREIETVFLMADPRHQAIASKLVKEIALLGGDVTKFVS